MMDSSRELENAFKQIITAGWAMKSDGDVEAPTGHFAAIPINSAEMPELLDAVFGDDRPEVEIDPGCYFAKEDSAGNMWLWCFGSAYEMNSMYERYRREYEEWARDTYTLECSLCKGRYDDLEEAADHGHTEYFSWSIVAESRAV
jgi:hypothetical protein